MFQSFLASLSVIILVLFMFACNEWVFAGIISCVFIVAGYAGYQYAVFSLRRGHD